MTPEWESAARRGSVDELRQLRTMGADLDARDQHGQTALMIAAHEGHAPVVDWLVERGAALDHTAKFGLSALMLAVVAGRTEIVRRLATAGADVTLRGTGAPGFADKRALDLAMARNNREMIAILSDVERRTTGNLHFDTAASWEAAQGMLSFRPLEPTSTGGLRLESLRVHVRDHKLRDLARADRTLEAHYGRFVLSEARRGEAEARRLALDVPYGRAGRDGWIAGHAARLYERGPEPPPDDVDGRSPSVVVWHDGDMFYLLASEDMTSDELAGIAASLYG